MPEQLNMLLPVEGDSVIVETSESASARHLINDLIVGNALVGLIIAPAKAGKSTLAVAALAKGLRVMDDADVNTDERGLFHAINWSRETQTPLLIFSATPLDAWTVEMPDLSSRLRALPIAEITAPSTTTLGLLLAKRFSDAQTRVDASVVDYLVARMDRSYATLDALVARVTAKALAQQRPVTVPLVRELL